MRFLLAILPLTFASLLAGCPQPLSNAKTPPISTTVREPVNVETVKAPQNYHILQDQGGIPLTEAARSGLKGAGYAYLRSMVPAQQSEGVEVNDSATVRSKRYEIGYRFETRPVEKQELEFNIQGQWDELHFGFGFDDNSPSDPEGKRKIELTVLLDGKQEYVSSPLAPTDVPIFTSLNVKGVQRVMFIVRRIGYDNAFAPLLIDPFLVKAAAAPAP